MALQPDKKLKSFISRRDFIKISGAGLVSSVFGRPTIKKNELSVHVFSKHLQSGSTNW